MTMGPSTLTACNCTIVDNDNYGIKNEYGCNEDILNCILWNNGDDLYDCEATYSCIEDGDAGTGNISTDPCFVPSDEFYHLQLNSPCIGTGLEDSCSDGLDIDNELRVMGTNIDMGSDEAKKGVHNETQDAWYDAINDAIDDANNGDTIVAMPDTYYESVNFDSKNITLSSIDPCDWNVVETTIIDGNEATNTVTMTYGLTGTITGFTITGGTNGAFCAYNGHPKLKRCIFTGNSSRGINTYGITVTVENCIIYGHADEGMYVQNSGLNLKNSLIYDNDIGVETGPTTPTIRNCTIVNNDSYGIRNTYPYNDPDITNCILWNNSNDLDGCEATYSCIEDGDTGAGNINDAPLFAAADSNNFRLRVESPCIGAGASGDYSDQLDLDNGPRLRGQYVDMGAYESKRVYNETQQLWYDVIHEAVDGAADGDSVIVSRGTYYDSFWVSISGDQKTVTVRSGDPNRMEVTDATIIDGNSADITVFYGLNSKHSSLMGLTVTGGQRGISLYSTGSNTGVISNCIIRGNTDKGIRAKQCNKDIVNCIFKDNGEAIWLECGSLNITNNIIYDNDAGFVANGSANADIYNCTIVNNNDYGVKGPGPEVKNCILWNNNDDLYSCSATYSCIEDGDGGTGNISDDPCFVPDDELYHLDPNSLCIDVGDPNGTYTGQVDIDGDERVIDVAGKGDGTVDVDMGSDEYDPGS
jgi:hypothetical protein